LIAFAKAFDNSSIPLSRDNSQRMRRMQQMETDNPPLSAASAQIRWESGCEFRDLIFWTNLVLQKPIIDTTGFRV